MVNHRGTCLQTKPVNVSFSRFQTQKTRPISERIITSSSRKTQIVNLNTLTFVHNRSKELQRKNVSVWSI